MSGTQTHTDTGMIGAKRQSWSRANPRDVLKRVIDKKPDMEQDDAQEECWDMIRKDQQMIRTIFEYWFANNYRSLVINTKPNAPNGSAASPAPASSPKQELATAIRARIDEKIEHRVTIALLQMILPNGKELRLATREELLKVGGWMRRVADRLQPGQTVEEAGLSEQQLHEFYDPQAAP
jgi:hypothetical protein